MSSLDDLLRRLDAAGPTGWEDEYARSPVELTRDQAFDVVASARACAEWFAFRFDAGSPGVPLPPHEQALEAVLRGTVGTPLDAYRVVFPPRPMPEGAPADLLLAVLCNSAACALKRGTTWLATWLAARAGLASIALGAPDRAWLFLDGLTIDGRRHPQLDTLAVFEPVRGNPVLERSPWVRAAICRLWPALGVPAVPRIPFPAKAVWDGASLEATLDGLSRIGADRVRALVESFVDTANRVAIAEYTDHPLVRELRARAMVPGSAAPGGEELPAWFDDWARAVARAGEPHLARLAGLVLHAAGAGDRVLAAVLVLPAARATDLNVLAAGLDAPELRPLLDELGVVARVLPVTVADALVAAALPGHVDQGKALQVLAQHVDVLEGLETKVGGVVEHVTGVIRSLVQDRARDHATERSRHERLLTAVRQAAARLTDTRIPGAQDVERVAGAIDVPELTTGFIELAAEADGLGRLEKLLLALALRRAVEGTEHEDHWRAPLSKVASDAVFALRAPALFELRLRLLDEIIAAAHPLMSLAELHFQRANTRRTLSPDDPRETDLVLGDLRTAVRLSRAEGDTRQCAAATAAWVKTLAWTDAGGDHPGAVSIEEANRVIDEALGLPLDRVDQALLHQARAHLVRPGNPKDAALALEAALALVSEEDPFRAELAAELVATLVRAHRVDEAVDRGLAFIESASCGTERTELGMLHLALGEALAASGRSTEARRPLEAGLALVRGRDALNEALAHLHLARLGLATGDQELAEEHLRLLQDRRDDLDPLTRRDVHALEAAAAKAWGHVDAQRSDAPRPERFREELKIVYPARVAEIDAPAAVAAKRDVDSVLRLLNHPAGTAFMKVRTRLMSARERSSDPLGLMDRFSASVKATIEEQARRGSLFGRPDECEAVLGAMADVPTGAGRLGDLAGRVVLIAHLARLGRRTADDVRAATTEAIAALAGLDDAIVRSALLREIAVVWAPNDHSEDPLSDFALAADLLRQCVDLEGGEEQALDDTLAYLARALRYSSEGDHQANLRASRRLFGKCLDRARVSGGPDLVANFVHNLSEVESQMGAGSRLERLRRSEAGLREAANIARSPHRRAQFTANLAWELTQIGNLSGGPEGRQHMEQALATFDHVDVSLLEDHARRNVAGNRTVCEATLARLTGGRAAEIAVWRRYLGSLEPAAGPYSVATAKHNLANALMFGEDVTPAEIAEGLRLCREAAEVRTLEANPRHHWETAVNAGRAILGALRRERFDLLPVRPREATEEAQAWLRRAIGAARVLGPGEELADAAFALCELGLVAISTRDVIDQTEGAWAVVREAAPYLLLHGESREREAWTALHAAAGLAYRFAERALVATPGLAFVLHGDNADVVARWMLRGQEPARRPLRARLSRPHAVSAGLWESWLSALGERDERRVADVLDRIRAEAPDFPADSAANDATWRWLLARPGSVAVALILAKPASIALVMHVDGTGRRRTWVLGLEVPPPPMPLDTLADLMRGAVPGAQSGGALEVLAAWLREYAVGPVERFLGARPTAVLWSPGPGLRLLAPGSIWRGVPVATTATLALPDLTASPGRRRSTLVVLADPSDHAPEPRLDLRERGVLALETLSRAATTMGPIRLLGSVGGRFGRGLLGERTEVRDTPASARDVLAEAGEHDVVVLIAHGQVETLEAGAILCIDKAGNIDRLDVAKLGREPDRFAGATVLLLSCDAGRVGDSLSEPGGIAGTLVSAGARCVVAPLWPVRLDVAVQVGEAVLQGLARGAEPWEILTELQVDGTRDSPTLGGPPPSLSERQAARDLQGMAFVTWVG
ncbi:MAG: CHAT domain-containing protein [Archangium sp.]|nr:CHAT domain-containing protein [Archangium sp.]